MPTDNFDREDANPIGGNWTTAPSSNALQIVSNTARPSTTGSNAAYWNADAFDNDQYSQVVVTNVTADIGAVAPAVRMSTTAKSFYMLEVSTTQWQFSQYLNGNYSTIGDIQSKAISDGDTVKIHCVGNTLYAAFNGSVEAYTGTGGDIAAGSAGIAFYGNEAIADNWDGGNGTGPAPATGGVFTIFDKGIFRGVMRGMRCL